jgi:SAM-dependent methyltransferase
MPNLVPAVRMTQHDNLDTWRRQDVADAYEAATWFEPVEEQVLPRLAAAIRGGAILDLGVGGGRTVPLLTKLSDNYIGVDYSPEMIARCRQRFPGVRFELADARDLSRFPDRHFDLIVFSFNGLDYVPHDDRLRILGEVRRLLTDDGVFFFCSHNLDAERQNAYSLRSIAWSWNLRRLLGRVLYYGRGVVNHRRRRHQEVWQDDYAIVNDGENFTLLCYYIRPSHQIEQLRAAGFSSIEVLTPDGTTLETSAGPSAWVYYIARRQA